MTVVLEFIDDSQGIEMQRLNQFWYDKAVSRIMTRLALPCHRVMLTIPDKKLGHTVWILNTTSLKIDKLRNEKLFDFANYTSFQVR